MKPTVSHHAPASKPPLGQPAPARGTVEPIRFDYTNVDADTASLIEERTALIHDLGKRTVGNMVAIGKALADVKEVLPHGQWLSWLEQEFDWSDDTARNLMNAAAFFKSRTVRDLQIDAGALYKIAAPNTPEPVREEAIRRAEAGEHITRTAVAEILTEHKPTTVVKTGKKAETAPSKPQGEPKESGPPPTKRQQILANAAYRVLVDVLSQTNGLCRVVADFNIPLIRLACTDQELTKWERMARRCAKTLRAFAAQRSNERIHATQTRQNHCR